jgi:osmotically inducible protein OsmC
MLAASAAACMSMMIAQETARQHLHPQDISTTATLKLEELEEGWTVTEIHLDVAVRIREADPAAFQKALEAARKKCSVSRALKCNITTSTRLEPATSSAMV